MSGRAFERESKRGGGERLSERVCERVPEGVLSMSAGTWCTVSWQRGYSSPSSLIPLARRAMLRMVARSHHRNTHTTHRQQRGNVSERWKAASTFLSGSLVGRIIFDWEFDWAYLDQRTRRENTSLPPAVFPPSPNHPRPPDKGQGLVCEPQTVAMEAPPAPLRIS